ncbi:MAG: MFS transporter [Chloroflexia bacterium]|nr:MFS transporter [Chloroflexia bacterium]
MQVRRFWPVFVAFALGYMVASFLRSANAVISPDLMREMTLNADQLGSMTSLYYISFSLMQLPLGAALDRYGSRLIIPLLMIPTMIGCILFATATSFWPLVIGRTLIGLGTAGGLMGAVKTFGHWVPSNRLATMTSIMVAIGACGGLLSTTPMAYVAHTFGWRSVFVYSMPIVLLIAIIIRVFAHDAPPSTTIVPSQGNPFAGYRKIYSLRDFWHMAPLYFSMLGTMLAVQTLWAGPFLYDIANYTSAQTGVLLLVLGAGAVAGYAVSGYLADRFGVTTIVVLSQSIMLTTLCYFVVVPTWTAPWLLTIIYAIFGFGASFNVIMLPQARRMFDHDLSGRVATALNVFGFVGAWVVQWVMGLAINAVGRDASGHYQALGYQWAFSIPLCLGCIALCIYLPLHVRTIRKGA